MSEGPQVKLRTEWLTRYLTGRTVMSSGSGRTDVSALQDAVRGRTVVRCYCHGKHIFIEFDGGLTLHNHLLMRGKWRRESGQLLLLTDDIWLSLYVGPYTIYNRHGQKLELLDPPEVAEVLNALGPDVMADPFPEAAVRKALRQTGLQVAEAILDQGIICGLGNVARSEALFVAGVSPFLPARSLPDTTFRDLCNAIQHVMGESYATGGRWFHRVYRRAGQPCPQCGLKIQLVKLPPSRRSVYFCPRCQPLTTS